jgi:O-antigen/teichoic acid export membrane protein
MTGTALAQAIPFFMLPVLQRWFFDTDDFGLLTLYISVAGFLINSASFKYEYAIVTQRRLKDAANIILLCFVLIIGVSLLTLLTVFLFNDSITEALKDDRISPFLYLLPISVLSYGGYQVFNYWFNREKRFKTMAASKVVQTSTGESIKLGAGVGGANAGGLIVGRVIGQFISFSYMSIIFLKRQKKLFKLFSWKHARKMGKKEINFPMFSAPSAIIGAFVPVVFVNLFLGYFGSSWVGVIGASTSYIGAGTGILSLAISQVYYQRISEIKGRAALRKNYASFVGKMFLLAGIMVATIYLIPNSWIVAILGNEWKEMMPIMRIIVIWIGISFVSTSLSFIYIRVRKQKVMLLFAALNLLMVIGSISWGYQQYGDVISTLWCFTIAQSLYYILTIFAAFVFINQYKEEE